MINPWMILGFLIALIAAAGTSYFKGEAQGKAQERAVWTERELSQVTAAAKKMKDLQDAARAKEAESALAMDRVSTQYEGVLKNAKDQRDKDIAAARGGTIGLRVAAACPGAGGGPAAPPGPAPGIGDGPRDAELPREVVADLLALADDADRVVEKLTACQGIIEADRK